jgi:hypothetical protein
MELPSMSFDIFFQRLAGGDLSESAAGIAEAYLAPMVKERDASWARIRTVDGEADVYGMDRLATSVMINHASGRAVWDVMFELARIGGYAVMPVGCGTCITEAVDPSHLPAELPGPITVVRSGQDLLDVVERA